MAMEAVGMPVVVGMVHLNLAGKALRLVGPNVLMARVPGKRATTFQALVIPA